MRAQCVVTRAKANGRAKTLQVVYAYDGGFKLHDVADSSADSLAARGSAQSRTGMCVRLCFSGRLYEFVGLVVVILTSFIGNLF